MPATLLAVFVLAHIGTQSAFYVSVSGMDHICTTNTQIFWLPHEPGICSRACAGITSLTCLLTLSTLRRRSWVTAYLWHSSGWDVALGLQAPGPHSRSVTAAAACHVVDGELLDVETR